MGVKMINYNIKRNNETEEIYISNGMINIIVVPQQGGRILEYSINGFNVLYRNEELIGVRNDINKERTPENWLNFGGYKCWPAPQTVWQWPPIFDIDQSYFNYEINSSKDFIDIKLTSNISKTEPVQGLQFIRTITIYDNCSNMCVEETIVNNSESTVQWAMWDNTQVLSPGFAEIKLNSNVFTGGITFYQDFDIPSSNAYSVRREDRKILTINCNRKEKFKVGVVTDSGEISYRCTAYDKDIILKKQFKYEGQVVYPHGSNIEVYVDTTLPYAELEILGGMKNIEPNKSISLKVNWNLSIG
ncbi:MAG: hypothetical protein K0R54_1322 [Clostridiaceae bacterium]|jgi:hypothetical protein|nr:hypothetical protein [Clostridiaceae bacterium]